jgi:hypothetical protein
MSDDLFESFGDEDLFEDEEEEISGEAEGEGQNRTFIIAVAVLGGLLVCALAAFGVWALVINPRQAQNQLPQAQPSPTVTATMEEAVAATATEVAATDTPEPEPTDTPEPEPTDTPVMGPTRTPTPEVTETPEPGEADGDTDVSQEMPGDEDGTPTSTPRPRRTATPRPTPTPRPEDPTAGDTDGMDQDEELSQTGLGEWLLAGAAVLLIGVALLARRLRSA